MLSNNAKKSYRIFGRIASGIISCIMAANLIAADLAGYSESTLFSAGEIFAVEEVFDAEEICGEEEVYGSEEILDEEVYDSNEVYGTAGVYSVEPFSAAQFEGLEYTVELKSNGLWRVIFSGSTSIPAYITDSEEFKDYKDNIDEIVIGSDITGIEAHAFEGLPGLGTVIFEENTNLIKIGDAAFKNCTYLNSINLENCKALERIGDSATGNESAEGAFENTGLKQITIPANLRSIGDNSFRRCQSLVNVHIEEDCQVEYFGVLSFANCEALESINLENCTADDIIFKCNSLWSAAFYQCRSLKSVIIPSGATGNLSGLFADARALSSITFMPNSHNITNIASIVQNTSVDVLDLRPLTGMVEIGSWQIRGPMSTVIVPGTLRYLGMSVMGENTSTLNTVIFEENSSIGDIPVDAFAGDGSLISVNLDALSSLWRISDNAFKNCSVLPSIDLPSDLSTLGNNVFEGCVGLMTLKYNARNLKYLGTDIFRDAGKFDLLIGPDVNEISVEFLRQAQDHITGIKFESPVTFTVGSEGESTGLSAPFKTGGTYSADGSGNLYKIENGTAKLIYANRSASELTIPASINGCPVTAIGEKAFEGCSLTKLTVEAPENILVLEDYAFAGAIALEEINGRKTVDEVKELFSGSFIGSNVFYKTEIGKESGITEEDVFDTEATAQDHQDSISIQRSNDRNETVTGLNINLNTYNEIKPEEDAERAGKFWTGDAAIVTVGGAGSYPVRIYIRAAEGCEIYSDDGTSIDPKPTDTEGIYYFDFDYSASGSTSIKNITISYPNFSAPGSKVQIWGVEFDSVVDYQQFMESPSSDSVIYPASSDENGAGSGSEDGVHEYSYMVTNEYFEIEWTTKPHNFDLKKVYRSDSRPELIKASDGKTTLKNLSYNVTFSSPDSSGENRGSDLIRYVDYSDTLALPETLKWRDGISENLGTVHFTLNNSGGTLYVTVGGVEYELCTVSGFTNLVDMSVKTAENGGYTLRWRVINTSLTAEITAVPNGTITFGPEVLVADGISAGAPIGNIYNTLVANEHFSFSDTKTGTDECAATPFIDEKGELVISKERLNDITRMGEDVSYKITVENPSAFDYTDLDYIYDLFQGDFYGIPAHYLKPENMQLLFNGLDGDLLTITIIDAVLAKSLSQSKTVKTVNGSDVDIFLQNSADEPDQKYGGTDFEGSVASRNVTITLQKSGDNIVLSYYVENGTSKSILIGSGQEYNDIASALESIGYIVTVSDDYSLKWNYPDGYVLRGGDKKEFIINATIKDSLMFLPEEDAFSHYRYPESDVKIPFWNTVELHGEDNTDIRDSTFDENTYVGFDLYTEKGALVNGEKLAPEDFAVKEHDILDYRIKITHYGSGSYDVLPVVDHMTGLQAVIVRKDENAGAEWIAHADVYNDPNDGVEYYLLNQKYTYEGVYTNGFYADSITVNPVADGLDTIIKYYLKNTPGREFDLYVTYKAIVGPNYAGNGGTYSQYSVGNEAWLNDRPGHRLYSVIGTSGSDISFNKYIVKERGASPEEDELIKSMPIHNQNNTITYRLELTKVTKYASTGEIAPPTILTGKDIFDMLPLTGSAFDWQKKVNVSIAYCLGRAGLNKDDGSEEYGSFSYNNTKFLLSVGTEYRSNDAEWELTDKDPSEVNTNNNPDQQYIIWDEKFEISLPAASSVYIYVTLNFPDAVTDTVNWNKFLSEKANDTLVNSLFVQERISSVTHVVTGTPKAFLQKGVFETGTYVVDNARYLVNGYYPGTDRTHYTNNRVDKSNNGYPDTTNLTVNTVTYYVIIRNSGETNLYLTPFYDVLPQGFRYMALRNGFGNYWDSSYYVGNNNIKDCQDIPTQWGGADHLFAMPEKYDLWDVYLNHFRQARVKYYYDYNEPEFTDDGRQILRFDLYSDKSNGKDVLKYDESNGHYYLEPGAFIQFGYTVYTGDADITKALNTVAMQYYDPYNTGVSPELDKSTNLAFSQSFTGEHNDGDRYLWDNDEAESMGYDGAIFGSANPNAQWFASGVAVETDNPVPGIRKTVDRSLVKSGNPVTWTVSSYNEGNASISGYTITDTVDSPLYFEGEFRYSLYGPGSIYSYARAVDAGGNPFLFRIKRTREHKESIIIYPNTSPEEGVSLTYGEEKTLNVIIAHDNSSLNKEYLISEITVKLTCAANGDETLVIAFSDKEWDIISGGYGELIVPTSTSDVGDNNAGVYNNEAIFSPDDKEYDRRKVTKGEPLTEDGKNQGVKSSASVNIYYGTPSASLKMIEEKVNPENNASSDNPNDNYIVLENDEKVFTYTLEVRNVSSTDNQGAMDQLVIIDNLPEPGDSSLLRSEQRESEFKVSFADNPNVSVLMNENYANPDSEYKEITEKEINYTVQYSDMSGNFSEDDWQGEDTEKWYDTPTADTRSIRICIAKSQSESIPAGASVRVRFDAVINDPAVKPGEIAWNSFGYSYSVGGTKAKAFPAKVGVRIPGVPAIAKRTVNSKGAATTVPEDTAFKFIIYKSADAVEFTGYSADEVTKALTDRDIKFMYVELEVPKGKSESDPVYLEKFKVYSYANGVFIEGSSEEWIKDEVYHVVELETNDNYSHSSTSGRHGSDFSSADDNEFSFTFDDDGNIWLTVTNEHDAWSIKLTKTDNSGAALKGALFGIYTSDKSKKMSDSDFESLNIENRHKTVTSDGTVYYLMDVKESPESGVIEWDGLTEEVYVVSELKAPDGYNIGSGVYVIRRDEAVDNVYRFSVKNSAMIDLPIGLPDTGGPGTKIIYQLGITLMLGFIGALLYIRSRRRRIL